MLQLALCLDQQLARCNGVPHAVFERDADGPPAPWASVMLQPCGGGCENRGPMARLLLHGVNPGNRDVAPEKASRYPSLLQTLRRTLVDASIIILAVIGFRACGDACAEVITAARDKVELFLHQFDRGFFRCVSHDQFSSLQIGRAIPAQREDLRQQLCAPL
jgi:hypothetical protein